MQEILLVLSPKHQKELNYSERSVFTQLNLSDYDLDNLSRSDEMRIKARVRDDLLIPVGYIENYYVSYDNRTVHIRQAKIEVL